MELVSEVEGLEIFSAVFDRFSQLKLLHLYVIGVMTHSLI